MTLLFLTARSDSSDIVSGFRSGADDYVVKPFALEVLYSRILALLRRTGNVAEQYLSCNGIMIDLNRHAVFCHSEEISLSAAEYQLLLCLMQNKGKTVTREKNLGQVWDVNGSYVNNNTLAVTMKRLRDKLAQPPCRCELMHSGQWSRHCSFDRNEMILSDGWAAYFLSVLWNNTDNRFLKICFTHNKYEKKQKLLALTIDEC